MRDSGHFWRDGALWWGGACGGPSAEAGKALVFDMGSCCKGVGLIIIY